MGTVYADLDSDGNEAVHNSMSYKARVGKTELQRQALTACKLQRFDSREQHKAFEKEEDRAIGKTDEKVLQRAWMVKCIQDATIYNQRGHYTINELIRKFGRDDLRDAWLTNERRAEILKKRPVTNVPAVVKGTAHLHPATKRRIPDEVVQLIAKLESLLKVNIRETVPNLEAAAKILEDGRDPEVWYEWFSQSKIRLENANTYSNLAKVWESWPQAFEVVNNVQATRMLRPFLSPYRPL